MKWNAEVGIIRFWIADFGFFLKTWPQKGAKKRKS
jgi:hypothetical protein